MTAPQLYVRDGSRFVPVDGHPTAPLPPLPIPATVPDVDEDLVDERPNFTPVDAPRCPHGSFARWAVRNCCAR